MARVTTIAFALAILSVQRRVTPAVALSLVDEGNLLTEECSWNVVPGAHEARRPAATILAG